MGNTEVWHVRRMACVIMPESDWCEITMAHQDLSEIIDAMAYVVRVSVEVQLLR
jgi:hypothetical protein